MLESSISISRQELSIEITEMTSLVDRTIRTGRRLVTELRPEVLDHLARKSGKEWQEQEFNLRTKISIEIHSELDTIEVED